jgi:shikimate dehydrogenase
MENLFFIIGNPVSHSISPCIHNTLFAQYSLEGCYVPVSITKEQLGPFFKDLGNSFRGGNVTVPHKVACLPFMNILGEEVDYTGAINTVTVEEDGKLRGNNTDCFGFIASLEAETGAPIPEPVALFGAGGAARGILYGLLQTGVKEVFLFNRTPGKARALAHEMEKAFDTAKIREISPGSRDHEGALESSNLVVNATSLGLIEEFTDFPFSRVKKGAILVDIVYKDETTFLVKEGRRRGIQCVSGLPMLAAQAAFAFQHFTGILPEYHLVREIALSCLKNRIQ